MALSLKISNIVGNELELILRLKKVNSPGKKKLLKSLANGDWIAIYTELLFRIELYTETKVLNYTRKDLNNFVVSIRAIGIDKIAQALVEKFLTPEQQVASQLVIDESLALENDEKYVVLCEWDENDEKEWDVYATNDNLGLSRDEAIEIRDSAKWDGPDMNQRFIIVTLEKYFEKLNSESVLNESEGFLNLDESFKKIFS